jgi:hypothetical protein
MARCIECERLTFKNPSKLVRLGLGNCELLRRYEFVSPLIERECKTFTPATPERAEAGRAFLARLAQPRKETIK